jgi:xylan 1,4-beta-xylosidase
MFLARNVYCLLAAVLALLATGSVSGGDMPRTYCNPLPIPDYPLGREARQANGEPADSDLWITPKKEQFRELADPTVLFHDGKWYLYPSCDMAWVSEDFVTWKHRPLDGTRDIGYAPTVVLHKGRFLLAASGDTAIYAGGSPLGTFKRIGNIVGRDGQPPYKWWDPMFFSDDDGRLYVYWGSDIKKIVGAEVDAADPTKIVSEAQEMFPYNPAHKWERFGQYNEDATKSWPEGAWMLKHNGRYYLTFSAPGTQLRTYAMGCYVGEKPLGPFKYQSLNPICTHSCGLIVGTGHGCIVRGPNDTLWAFYTCFAGYAHAFERRIGMDPAGFDEQGNLSVRAGSSTPQLAPGVRPHPELGNDADWPPVNLTMPARATSAAPGRDALYAVDESLRTWWQPADGDAKPALESMLTGRQMVRSVRVIWRDVGLNTNAGVNPGPFQYRVEARDGDGPWKTVLDRTASKEDLIIDYREVKPVAAERARLVITGWPRGITPGVVEFTVFGDQKFE